MRKNKINGNEKPLILIVDDTPLNIRILAAALKDDYEIRIANNGEEALKMATKIPGPDLILLDIMMPKMDGYGVLERLKKMPETKEIPVIFVTALSKESDEEKGLKLGAIDYITKPYNLPLLLVRIKNLLKRTEPFDKQKLEYKGITLNLISGNVGYREVISELSRTELKIMYYLFKNAGNIVPRMDLVEYLWDNQIHIDDNALSVNMSRIREKLANIGINDLIITRRGMGYKI